MADPKNYQVKIKIGTEGEQSAVRLKADLDAIGKIDAFRKLKTDLEASRKAWQDAHGNVAALAEGLRAVGPPSKGMIKDFEAAKKTAAALKDEYKADELSLNGIRKEMLAAGISAKNLASEQVRLKQALAQSRSEAEMAAQVKMARGILDVRPHAEIQKEIERTRLAYQTLLKSGSLSTAELAQAQAKLKQKTAELGNEMNKSQTFTGGWADIMGKARQAVLAFISAYAGLQALKSVKDIMADAETSAYNMESSIKAANREFGNTGDVDAWKNSISGLSDYLKIYSDTELKNAISRTIDMTKRLGLEKDQMDVVIQRSGDLAAGKIDLFGAIEKTTSALRGEAESAEYLGLTLGGTYVEAWYKANEAHGRAWESLTDTEKSLVRFKILLEQTNEVTGRSAAYAGTYAGALEKVSAEINNIIANSKTVQEAMSGVTKSIQANNPAIKNLVEGSVYAFGKIVQAGVWLLENLNNFFARIAGGFTKLVAVAKLGALELEKAWASVFGDDDQVQGIQRKIDAQKRYLDVVNQSIQADDKAGRALWSFGEDAKSALESAGGSADGLTEKILPIPKLIVASKDAIENFEKAGKQAYETLKKQSQEYADKIKELNESIENRQIDTEDKIRNLRRGNMADEAALADVRVQAAEKTAAAEKALQEFRKTGDEGAADRARRLAKDAESLWDEIGNAANASAQKALDGNQSAAEKMRDIQQESADLNEKQAERRAELERELADEYQALMDKSHGSETSNLADELNQYEESARQKREDLKDQEVRESEAHQRRMAELDELKNKLPAFAEGGVKGTDEAIAGLEKIKSILDATDKTELSMFERLQKDATDAMTEIQSQLDKLDMEKSVQVEVDQAALDIAHGIIADLLRADTKKIYIETIEKKSSGGRVGMATGGRFPGNSTIDSIPVLARPGEGFVRNEALSVWDRLFGTGFFHGINNPWSVDGKKIIEAMKGMRREINFSIPALPDPSCLAFAGGGRVPDLDVRDMGTVALDFGGKSYPVMGKVDVINELKAAIAQEKRMRPQR